ncbi:hypothetical protein HZA57_10170, partial [Candidatus Poribacteria bacterium]|nr:hypothetical protein [Candidatus Poribacteria bacterium]
MTHSTPCHDGGSIGTLGQTGADGMPENHDRDAIANRRSDWRFGHVIYQIFVDRFAPSTRLESKREHYAPPRVLRRWDEQPAKGQFNAAERVSAAELEFWGGDLDGVRRKLDYLHNLGVDVVYLNPIFEAFSNHKYDGNDFFRVDPQFGSREELAALADDLHGRGMRL